MSTISAVIPPGCSPSSALVLLMTVGLALLLRRPGALQERAQHHDDEHRGPGRHRRPLGPVGYSLAFAPGDGLAGGLGWLGFQGVGLEPDPHVRTTIPLQAHAVFQGMFAIITPALISGAIVERMQFRAYVAFIVLWATLVYVPLAHWVWGAGGWLLKLGALDFAGGTVVHISAGVSALVAASSSGPAWAFGARRSRRTTCRSCCSARACCGSAGSASTRARRWRRTASRRSRSSTPTPPPRPRWSPGLLLDTMRGAARSQPSAPPPGAVVGLVGITPAAGYVTARAAPSPSASSAPW